MVYNTYRWLTADRLNENFSIYDVWKTDQTRFEFCTSFRIESIPNFTQRSGDSVCIGFYEVPMGNHTITMFSHWRKRQNRSRKADFEVAQRDLVDFTNVTYFKENTKKTRSKSFFPMSRNVLELTLLLNCRISRVHGLFWFALNFDVPDFNYAHFQSRSDLIIWFIETTRLRYADGQ